MLSSGCDDLPSQTQAVKGLVTLAALEWLYYKVITTAIVMGNMKWVRSRITEENGICRGICGGKIKPLPPAAVQPPVQYPRNSNP